MYASSLKFVYVYLQKIVAGSCLCDLTFYIELVFGILLYVGVAYKVFLHLGCFGNPYRKLMILAIDVCGMLLVGLKKREYLCKL